MSVAIKTEMDVYQCAKCGTGFRDDLRAFRSHQVRSECSRKRKLAECFEDEGPAAPPSDDDEVEQPPSKEKEVHVHDRSASRNYDRMEELRLRLQNRILKQRAGHFNPAPKSFLSFYPAIERAAIDPRGYFASRKPFNGNRSEFLFGMHFAENPRNTVKAANRLRDLLKSDGFDIDDVSMDQKTRMKKLYATIDEKDKFQKIALYRNLSIADRGVQVSFYVRSLYAAACRLISRFDASEFDFQLERVLNEDGVRVYNREIASTDRLQRTKAWVADRYGPDVITLPLYFGWDGVRRLYGVCAMFIHLSYNICTFACTIFVHLLVQCLYIFLYNVCTFPLQCL